MIVSFQVLQKHAGTYKYLQVLQEIQMVTENDLVLFILFYFTTQNYKNSSNL